MRNSKFFDENNNPTPTFEKLKELTTTVDELFPGGLTLRTKMGLAELRGLITAEEYDLFMDYVIEHY